MAFQIRFAGSKGMISVDHRLQGRVICIRASMNKFKSEAREIEIAKAIERSGRMTLNRPMIMILEDLGVPKTVFLELQRTEVENVRRSMEDIVSASAVLETYGHGSSYHLPSLLNHLGNVCLNIQYLGDLDDFMRRILDYAANHILRELKHHCRIPVPKSYNLVGVADVYGFLEEGELLACVQEAGDSTPFYLEGRCAITRSPAIHPGDIQTVRTIGTPAPGSPYHVCPLPNCVVFSVKGER